MRRGSSCSSAWSDVMLFESIEQRGGGGGVTRREENEGKSSGVEDEDVSIFCNGASRAVIVGVSRTVIIDETSVLH